MARWNYALANFQGSDFIGPLDTWDYHFISAAPQEISGYQALIKIYDPLTWAFLFLSVVGVSIGLITINHWSHKSPKERAYESKKTSIKVSIVFFF